MIVCHRIKPQTYFDSVTLMLVGTELKKLPGVTNAVVGMGTDYNIDSLKRLGMYSDAFAGVTPADLVLAVQAADQRAGDAALAAAEDLLQRRQAPASRGAAYAPSTQEGGARLLPDANLVLISVPGPYAARETEIALAAGRHVMLFSDNVPLEDEVRLKEMAVRKGLLVMGPDCGTAIINQVPLAFANVVRPGDIGLVAASGTGLQEVTALITRLGFGISQAIGVGGRDLSEKVGGRMTLLAAQALADDPKTKVIVLISKPPAPAVVEALFAQLQQIRKPVVVYFIGADPQMITRAGFRAAAHLEDAALQACALAGGRPVSPLLSPEEIRRRAAGQTMPGRFIRGLYSGGTLCDEAQRLLQGALGEIWSNTPVPGCQALPDPFRSRGHCIVDLGDDTFTRGRAHPMIDPAYRQERLLAEAADPEVGLIFFDVVLGFGAHHDMAGAMAEAVRQVRARRGRQPRFAATILGTEGDPQNLRRQEATLAEAGIDTFPSNVALVTYVQHLIASKG